MKNIRVFLSENFQYLEVKFSIYIVFEEACFPNFFFRYPTLRTHRSVPSLY